MADWEDLRRRCEHRVRCLITTVGGLPKPWDIDAFLDRLEKAREREIDLCAVKWSVGESCGAWRRYPDHDVIAYSENTSGVHQDHIILHEIGHMISDHQGRCVLSADEAHRRAPDLTPAAFAHLLDRVATGAEESEAETIAIMMMAEIARQDHRRQLTSDRDLADRVDSAFG